MKRNPFFYQQEIAGNTYLLPFGQGIINHYHGLQLNQTGIYLWELLEKELSFQELLSQCALHFQISPTGLDALSRDLQEFIQQLTDHHALQPCELPGFSAPYLTTLSIGGLRLRLEGPAHAFSQTLLAFESPEPCNGEDMIFSLSPAEADCLETGELLLNASGFTVLDCNSYYYLRFPQNTYLFGFRMAKDGSRVLAYFRPSESTTLQTEVYHALREAFLYLASLRGMAVLHSASILYQGKAFLFSGPSGMGKSTHAALWSKTFGAPVLNGDLNLLTIEHGLPVIHGLPWCGSSNQFTTKTYPLAGIIHLKRSPDRNSIEPLSVADQILVTDKRLISPSWTPDLFHKNLTLIQSITPHILICRLHCTKDPAAAVAMKNYIDRYLTKDI